MADWTEDDLFQRMPRACRRALASFTGPDRATAMQLAWDHCPDAVTLLWLAAVLAPQKGAQRRVLEEIERAKARVLEHINDPASDPAKRGEDRLVVHLEQPLAILQTSPANPDRMAEWDKDLEGPLPREQWIEYVRRMDFIVEGIRINLRDVVVD
jgi:hypothetical protein